MLFAMLFFASFCPALSLLKIQTKDKEIHWLIHQTINPFYNKLFICKPLKAELDCGLFLQTWKSKILASLTRKAHRSLTQTLDKSSGKHMSSHTTSLCHTHRHYTQRPPIPTVFFTQHWPPPNSSRGCLTGWHVKTVIFRHTSPAVCWLFSWYHGDRKGRERAANKVRGHSSSPNSPDY